MKLSVIERLVALPILPENGDFVTLGVIRKAQEMLSFTEEEMAKYKFKNIEGRDEKGNPTQQTQWDNKAEQITDIRLGNKAISIIGEKLEEMAKNAKEKKDPKQFPVLALKHYTLYEKFVEKQK